MNIKVQKIHGTILETYEIVLFIFSTLDKDNRERFLEKNFLFANIIVLKILFFIINNTDIDLQIQNLQSRFYSNRDVLLTLDKLS